MKKYAFLLSLLVTSIALAIVPADKQFLATQNLLDNPGWEAGRAGWGASSASTYTLHTATPIFGTTSAQFLATAGSQTLTSRQYTIPSGMAGSNCEASVSFTGDGSAYTLQAIDGSAVVLGSVALSAAGSVRRDPAVTFICPTSGTIALRLVSNSAGAALRLDNAHLGTNRGLSQVSQATWFGSAAMVGIVNCTYTTTSASFATFAADADCNNSTATGQIAAPSTKQIGFSGTLAPGVYLIQASLNNLDSAAASHGFRMIAGATTSSEFRYTFRDGTTGSYQASAYFILTLTTPYTGDVLLQGLTSGGGTLSVVNNLTSLRLGLDVFRFPSTQEQAYRTDILPASVSAQLTGGTTWATASASFVDVTAAGWTLTTNVNTARNLTVTQFGTNPGFTFTPPRTGNYLICSSAGVSNTNASSSGVFQLTDGTNVILPGQIFTAATASAGGTVSGCAGWNASSLAAANIRWQARQLNNTAQITGPVTISITALDSPMVSPVLVGSVSSATTGQIRHEFVAFGGASEPSACTSTPCTIYRTSAGATVTRASAGRYTLTWPAGTFSATPVCSGSTGSATQGFPLFEGLSATSYTVNFNNNASAAADTNMQIVCTGNR